MIEAVLLVALGQRMRSFALAACLASLTAIAAPAQRIDYTALRVELVTVGPGPDFFSWSGHTALRITERTTGRHWLFDYGLIHVGPRNTLAIFTGRVIAFAHVSDDRVRFAQWTAERRSVARQELRLTAVASATLLRQLFADQNSPRRAYRYDVQTNNCTTLVRDLLDAATNGALHRAGSGSAGATVREIGYRYLGAGWLRVRSSGQQSRRRADQPVGRGHVPGGTRCAGGARVRG